MSTELKNAFCKALETLSPRESQIFMGYLQGLTPGEIAREFNLSIKTVSTFNTRMFKKFGVSKFTNLIITTALTFPEFFKKAADIDIHKKIDMASFIRDAKRDLQNHSEAVIDNDPSSAL